MVLDHRLRLVVSCLPGSRPLVGGTLEVPGKPITNMAGPKICAFPCPHRLFHPPSHEGPGSLDPHRRANDHG